VRGGGGGMGGGFEPQAILLFHVPSFNINSSEELAFLIVPVTI
jgi:hypothetical protein